MVPAEPRPYLRTVTRSFRIALVTVGVCALAMLMPAGRLGASACVIGYASEWLEMSEKGSVLFIGSVVANGDPMVLDVHAALKGPIGARVEVHTLEEFSVSQRTQAPPGSIVFVFAIRDPDGTIIFGPCLRPQLLETRTAAEQLVAAVPGAEARMSFDMLPEASALRVGAVPAPDPSPASSPPSNEVTGGAPAGWSGNVALASVVAIGGVFVLGLWLARRRTAALGLAVGVAIAGLAIGQSILSTPGGTTLSEALPAEPTPSPTDGVGRELIEVARIGDVATRDGPMLARRMELAGLGCVSREQRVDGWQSWECGGLVTAETAVRVHITSGLTDRTVWSYSVTYELRGGVAITQPVDPAEFGPFIAPVLDADRRAQLDEWLDQTWAIAGVSTSFEDFNARRQLATLHLDLEPGVHRP